LLGKRTLLKIGAKSGVHVNTRRAEGGDASGGFAPHSKRPSIGRHQTRLISFTALHGDLS
ncbi:MAG: hypothetical protein ACOYLS_16395, partial [Polymorphobacter sp.]